MVFGSLVVNTTSDFLLGNAVPNMETAETMLRTSVLFLFVLFLYFFDIFVIMPLIESS